MFTGVTRTKDLPITQEQLDSYEREGLLLQNAFPNLSADDREFVKTGVTKEEWDETFGEHDDADSRTKVSSN
jgi:hypothetical protein